MFERVAGVDPGIAATGLAVLEAGETGPSVVWAGTIRTPSGLDEASRLLRLHEALAEVFGEYPPAGLAIERLIWGRNATSAMGVARASGVALLIAAQRGIAAFEYAPGDVKMAVAGAGNASKAQVRASLERLHRVTGVPEEPNAADAAAVALCHFQRSGVRRALRGAGA